jgi:histidinol dehydrogenase
MKKSQTKLQNNNFMTYSKISIDSVSDSSEIFISANEKVNPKFVTLNILSQAEHN